MRGLTPAPGNPTAGSRPVAPNEARRRAMRMLRPPISPDRPAPALLAAGAGAGAGRCRVRLADGRVLSELAPARQRVLQLWLLHAETRELVELTPGTRRANGRLELD